MELEYYVKVSSNFKNHFYSFVVLFAHEWLSIHYSEAPPYIVERNTPLLDQTVG